MGILKIFQSCLEIPDLGCKHDAVHKSVRLCEQFLCHGKQPLVKQFGEAAVSKGLGCTYFCSSQLVAQLLRIRTYCEADSPDRHVASIATLNFTSGMTMSLLNRVLQVLETIIPKQLLMTAPGS